MTSGGGSSGGTGTTEPPKTSIDSVDYIVQFIISDQQQYGLDSKQHEVGQYDRVEIEEENYWVAWKSVEANRSDVVNAVTNKEQFPEAVGFKNQSGELPTQGTSNKNEKQVTVNGKIAGETESITAYVKVQEADEEEQEIELGRLNVVSYDKIREKVFLVPVNGAPC